MVCFLLNKLMFFYSIVEISTKEENASTEIIPEAKKPMSKPIKGQKQRRSSIKEKRKARTKKITPKTKILPKEHQQVLEQNLDPSGSSSSTYSIYSDYPPVPPTETTMEAFLPGNPANPPNPTPSPSLHIYPPLRPRVFPVARNYSVPLEEKYQQVINKNSNSYPPPPKDLYEILKEVAVENTVIISVFDAPFLSQFVTFYENSIRKLRLPNFLAFVLDQEGYKVCMLNRPLIG